MACEGQMVSPEVFTAAEINRDVIISVSFGIMLNIEVLEDDVVACGTAPVSAECNIPERVCGIASDDGLVAFHVDSAGRTVISAGRILFQCGHFDVLCDNDGIRCCGGRIFLEVIKSGNFHGFAEQTADVSRLDACAVIGAVACKTL